MDQSTVLFSMYGLHLRGDSNQGSEMKLSSKEERLLLDHRLAKGREHFKIELVFNRCTSNRTSTLFFKLLAVMILFCTESYDVPDPMK